MYTPATNTRIAENLINKKFPSLTSNVICLEDAIGEDEVPGAEKNLFLQMDILNRAVERGDITNDDLPLLFIRVRDQWQLHRLLKHADSLHLITGFNLPKFSSLNGDLYLEFIEEANRNFGETFYAMPILETPGVIYIESRRDEIERIHRYVTEHKDIVLNVRLGGTDFSGLYGIRRGIDFTIYDIQVINHALSDIINVFGRSEEGYTISGCVWEYFPDHNRLLKPQLRYTPFAEKKGKEGIRERKGIISKEIDGLIKEIILDKANGLIGKTIIHPSHIRYVNALQVVTFEEYKDALSILDHQGMGAIKGTSGNKMNEIKPHTNWAKKILDKAEIYGVLRENADYVELF